MPQPDFQPTLVGPTIIVRPIAAEDWTELFAAGADPEIWRVHPVPDRYTEAGFRKFFDSAVDSKMSFGKSLVCKVIPSSRKVKSTQSGRRT